MSVETWTERTSAGATAPRAQPRVARLRPKLGLADTLLQLWRAKWLMSLVFVPILLIGVAITLLAPTKFSANTRLLVRLGQEYVFDPVIGDAAKGAFPQQEEVLQAEAELARSPVIAERVIAGIGLSRLYPNFAEAKLRARNGAIYEVDQEALEAFAADFDVSSAPKSSILRMTFAHEDPTLAAATLNRLVTEYLKYRQEVLSGKGVAGLTEQRDVIEGRLAASDKSVRDFLARNGLSDFDAEQAAARKQFADISDELSKVEASLREAEAKSAGLLRQMGSTPKDVDLYVETTSEQDLVKLRLEREDLLARYLPDSRVVQDADRRIAQLEGFLKSAPAQGLRRIGPNPTWQALEADRAVQTATISALTGRSAALVVQKRAAEAQIAQLAALEPEYLRMKRDRDALANSAGTFATREQTERARSELASRSVDNISVYEAARPPTRGDSTKRMIAIAAALFGLLTALAVGLLRAWSVSSFPTASSVERTLGLRVLAAAKDRSA
ncbi:MAG: hypothetical protein IPO30_06520 [Hyphomonadaceae bacterium]|nr:hypothetical protein [Hyphomonadaceae bacterium]MBP9233382.1 hypothetical protein [Hyphomonadaceae bacterium]